MAQKLNLNSEVRELKLGSTFNSPKPRSSFHTLKYDFKPASIDLSKSATLDVSSNNQVTVTMPHLDSSGVPKTVFKGPQRNYTKECVLIIDKRTGEVTLEKLHHNIQVKKTRSEPNQKAATNFLLSTSASSSQLQSQQQQQQQSQYQSNSGNNSSSGGASGNHQTAHRQQQQRDREREQFQLREQQQQQQQQREQQLQQREREREREREQQQQQLQLQLQLQPPPPPAQYLENSTQRVSNKTRVSTGIRKNALGSFVQRHSPIQGSPSYPHHRSPQQAPVWNANNGQSTLPSIPMIGMDDDFVPKTNAITNGSQHYTAPSSSLIVEHTSKQGSKQHRSSNSSKSSSQKINKSFNDQSVQFDHNGRIGQSHSVNNLHNNSSQHKLQTPINHPHHQPKPKPKEDFNEIGVLSSSDSSDSSDSDSNSSDSDSDSDDEPQKLPAISNGTNSLPTLLDEDLRLSSNSSDSDDD